MKSVLLQIAVLVSPMLSMSGCLAHEESETASEGGPTDRASIPRGSKRVMPPMYEQALVQSGGLNLAIAAEAPTKIYLNGIGGVFTPGPEDATTNRTSLTRASVTFPSTTLSGVDWNKMVSCVRGQFTRFNVDITDIDPGNTPHYEAVVSGSPVLLNEPDGVGGISPFTSNCDMIPNSIVFIFTEVLPDDTQIVCEIVAQEIAHSFGLDHEFLCSDPMTYLTDCGSKSFQDLAAPCGEFNARPCAQAGRYDCGYQMQNSVRLLAERIGLRDSNLDPGLNEPTPQVTGGCSTSKRSTDSMTMLSLLGLAMLALRRRARQAQWRQ